MAIHIDIYAHLRRRELIKEGENLKDYIDHLEDDINKRLAKGATERTKVIQRASDAQTKAYHDEVNASDALILAKEREAKAERTLLALRSQTAKNKKEQKKLDDQLTAAANELASATRDRVFRSQQMAIATDNETRATRELAEQNAAYAKRQRDVGLLVMNNTKRFAKYRAETDKARQSLTTMNVANHSLIKDNRSIVDGLQRVREATSKTTEARRLLNKVTKDGTATYAQVKTASDRLKNAHKAEDQAIKQVTRSIEDLTGQHRRHTVTVTAGQRALKNFVATAQQERQQIKSLHATHEQVIVGNAKLSKSFETARASTKAASREYKEYRKLTRDGSVSQDALRKKAERVSDAYQRQARDVRAASTALGDLLTGQQQANVFVRSQSTAMRDYARSAMDAKSQIDHLHAAHQIQIRDSAGLSRAFNSVTIATKKATDAHQEYDRLVRSGAGRDDLRKQAKRASDAYVDQRMRVDEATEALKRNNQEHSRKRIRGLTGGMGEYVSRNIAALTPLGRVSGGVGIPLLGIAGSVAEAAVTASQSLALIPAAASAAAAGIGTLVIGMHGFIDVVGDMADPKKFAEGIRLLAPNAQQAALEIKALVDGPLGDLKKMVQDNLFAGVPQQLHALAGAFGPEMSKLFGGLSTEFNKAFMGLTNVLMTPEAQTSINNIIDGMVAGFHELLPVLKPLTEAFLTITEAGAGALPKLAESITQVATQFNAFVQGAAADGSLKEFIDKGMAAFGVLFDFIVDVGKEIYNVFGNKSPEEFRATLETVKDVVFDIAGAVVGLAHVINALMGPLGKIADAIGGWENLMYSFIALWTGMKLRGPIMAVAEMLGARGVMGRAMSGLPIVAGTAATGIGRALASIKIPPWLKMVGKFAKFAGWAGLAVGAGELAWEVFADDDGGPTDIPHQKSMQDIQRQADSGVYGPPGTKALPGQDPWDTNPADSGWAPHDVPTGSAAPGTYELANIPVGQFPGAQWNVPPGITDLPPDYDNIGKQGFYRPDPMKILQEQGDVEKAKADVEEKRIAALMLAQDANSTQDEINKANHNVMEAEQSWLQSVRKLKEAERGEFEDLTGTFDKFNSDLRDSLGGLGVALDPDLGISKGLPGIADNLVKFFATLGAAPVLGGMKAMQMKLGYPNNKDNGSGLMGILGALNGRYNEPGNYKDEADRKRAAYGIDQYGLQEVTPNGAVSKLRPGEGLSAGLAPAANYTAALLSQMFPNITSIGGKENRAPGSPQMHTKGRALDVMTGGDAGLGDRIAEFLKLNYQALGVQSYIWRDKGLNLVQNEGGGPGTTYGAGGHGGASGTDPGSHVHIQFGAGAPAPAGMPGGRVPDWDAIAQLESGGQWNLPSGDRDSTGGLQIRQGTWNDFGGQGIAPSPWQASKDQQIAIAEKILAAQGPNAWAGGKNFRWKEGTAGLPPGVPSIMAPNIPGAQTALPGVPTGSPVPVFVTNWPGGGFGGGGGGGGTGPGAGAGAGTGPNGGAGVGPGGGGTGPGMNRGPGVAKRNTPEGLNFGPGGFGGALPKGDLGPGLNFGLGGFGGAESTAKSPFLSEWAKALTGTGGTGVANPLTGPIGGGSPGGGMLDILGRMGGPGPPPGSSTYPPALMASGFLSPNGPALPPVEKTMVDLLNGVQGLPTPGGGTPGGSVFAGPYGGRFDKTIDSALAGVTGGPGGPGFNNYPLLGGMPGPNKSFLDVLRGGLGLNAGAPRGFDPANPAASLANDPLGSLTAYAAQKTTGASAGLPGPAGSRPPGPFPSTPEGQGHGSGLPTFIWSQLQKVMGFAGGGEVGSTDTQPALLTPGEHVLTTADVAAMGGQAGVQAFRDSLHGYQGGGGVEDEGFFGGMWNQAKDAVSGVYDMVRHPIDTFNALKPQPGQGFGIDTGRLKEFGKETTHWDEWGTNPAGAAGRTTTDLLSMLIPGGAAKAMRGRGVPDVPAGAATPGVPTEWPWERKVPLGMPGMPKNPMSAATNFHNDQDFLTQVRSFMERTGAAPGRDALLNENGNLDLSTVRDLADVQRQRQFDMQSEDPVLKMIRSFETKPTPPERLTPTGSSASIAQPLRSTPNASSSLSLAKSPSQELVNMMENFWVSPHTWSVYRDQMRETALRTHREGYTGIPEEEVPDLLELAREAWRDHRSYENLPPTDAGEAFAEWVGAEMQARIQHAKSFPDTFMRGETMTPERMAQFEPGSLYEMPISAWSTQPRVARAVAGDPAHRSSLSNIMSFEEQNEIYAALASGSRSVLLKAPRLQGANVGGETIAGGLMRVMGFQEGRVGSPHEITLQQEGLGYAKGGAVPIVAHSGEHVLTSKDVSAMGGQAGVYGFRNALHYDKGGAVKDLIFGPGGFGGAEPKSPVGNPLTAMLPPAAPPKPPPAPASPGPEPPPAPLAVPPAAAGPQHLTGIPGMPTALPGPPPGGEPIPLGVPTEGTPLGGQVDPNTGYGEGLNITGGIIGALTGAASGAAGGLDALAPGAGAAASAALQIGIEEIKAAIKFGAQATGIMAQGLQETFLPSGGSELANNNWLTRLVGGIVGSAPAIASGTGGKNAQLGKGQNLPGVGPATPEQIAAQAMDPNRAQHTGTGPPPGPTQAGVFIQNYQVNDTEDKAGQDLFNRYYAAGTR